MIFDRLVARRMNGKERVLDSDRTLLRYLWQVTYIRLFADRAIFFCDGLIFKGTFNRADLEQVWDWIHKRRSLLGRDVVCPDRCVRVHPKHIGQYYWKDTP